MKYTIYNPDSGEIQRVIFGDNADWMQQNLQGQSYVSGEYDGAKFYIQDQQAILKPANPSTTQLKYQFDYVTKSWVFDQQGSEQAIRKLRNIELNNVDKINPVWYSALTDAQKQELVDYRQGLLDVPQQDGFPQTIVWPSKPTWL